MYRVLLLGVLNLALHASEVILEGEITVNVEHGEGQLVVYIDA